jgi:hypothetical protein
MPRRQRSHARAAEVARVAQQPLRGAGVVDTSAREEREAEIRGEGSASRRRNVRSRHGVEDRVGRVTRDELSRMLDEAFRQSDRVRRKQLATDCTLRSIGGDAVVERAESVREIRGDAHHGDEHDRRDGESKRVACEPNTRQRGTSR